MSISRRLLFVLLLALSLGANTLADEADNSRALLDQTLQYWQQGDLDGIVSLFQANFEQAALAMANAPALIRDNTTTDDEIKSVVFAVNVLARVGDMTNQEGRGSSFGQLLAPNLMLVDASAWNGTPLAGPGPSIDTEFANQVISFCDRMGAYSQSVHLSRIFKQTLTLSFPPSRELEQARKALEANRHMGDAQLGVLASARRGLEELLAEGVEEPAAEFGIRFALALIGRRSGDGELLARHLEALAALAQKHRVYSTRSAQLLSAFSLSTFQYELEHSRDPAPLRDFLRSHADHWSLLQQVPTQREDLGGVGFAPVIWASEYWATEVMRRYGDPSLTDEERHWLSQALKQQGMTLAKWRDPELTTVHDRSELPFLNWEAICGFPYWNLAAASEARRQGKFQIAEYMLKGAENECNNVGGLFTRTLEEYPRIDAQATMQARVVGEIESELGRFYLAQYRQSGDKSKLERAYEKLNAARIQHSSTQNVSGMLEVAPDYLDAMTLLKPANWYNEALRVVEDVGKVGDYVGYRPALVVHHHYLSVLKESQGDLKGAVTESQQAVKLLEELVAQYGGLSPAGLRLKELSSVVYEQSTRLLTKNGDVQQAFVAIDRAQQLETLGQFEPKAGQSSPIATSFANVRRVRGEIVQLESSLGSRPNAPDIAQTKTKLNNARSNFYKEVTRLRQQHPDFERLLAVRPINFGQLQKSIPADTAVVQYFPSEEKLYQFVLTKEALLVRQTGVGQEALKDQISKFRKSIVRLDTDRELSNALYKTLIGPVEADIAGKKVLVLVPTGSLAYLPFAALEKDGSYLLESYQLAIVQQSSQLERLNQAPSSGNGALLVVGNPDKTLPSAEEEAEAVGGLFAKAKLLLRGEATLTHLIEGLKNPVSYLHLATHGVLDSTDPTASYIVLAGSRLHNYEIAALNLSGTRLVTLSACRTSIGAREPGSEVTSLAQAFGFAGAPCVVSTLWSIEDEQTKALMTEFYGRLKAGDSVALAMNKSQLALLKSPKAKDPYFWAGFQVGGDWR